MTDMKGFKAFEALNDVHDELIAESLEWFAPAAVSPVAGRKRGRGEGLFSRFFNSPWGVAILCAVVSIGVLGGIIWAGRNSVNTPVVPPGGQDETAGTAVATDEPVPPSLDGVFVSAGEVSVRPVACLVYDRAWDESTGAIQATHGGGFREHEDMDALLPALPALPYESDIAVHVTNSMTVVSVMVYDASLTMLATGDDMSVFASLPDGVYYVSVYVVEQGGYIPEAKGYEDAGYEYAFVLSVEGAVLIAPETEETETSSVPETKEIETVVLETVPSVPVVPGEPCGVSVMASFYIIDPGVFSVFVSMMGDESGEAFEADYPGFAGLTDEDRAEILPGLPTLRYTYLSGDYTVRLDEGYELVSTTVYNTEMTVVGTDVEALAPGQYYVSLFATYTVGQNRYGDDYVFKLSVTEPAVYVTSGDTVGAPVSFTLWDDIWDEDMGWLSNDGIGFVGNAQMSPEVLESLPKLTYASDLTIHHGAYHVSDMAGADIYDASLGEVAINADIGALAALPSGTYYVTISFVQQGRYIPSEVQVAAGIPVDLITQYHEESCYEYAFCLLVP